MLNKIKIINAKGVDNLNTKNLVALNFREDLIKLLEKYDCEISGTRIDDECINLEINFCFGSYIMQGSYNNYNITKKSGSKYENIIDNYILKHFPEHSSTMRGLNNIKIHTGIFTNNKSKAENKIKEIYSKFNKNNIYNLLNSKHHKELQLIDGSRYVWIKPNSSSRRYRCASAFIDRELTLEELQYNVFPMCVYCGRDTVEVF